MKWSKENFDALYKAYNRREFVHPDPLEFLYRYDDVRDREVAGLIASSLAYGNVKQILRSVASVLDPMGQTPASWLLAATKQKLEKTFGGFVHRWHRGRHVTALLEGIRQTLQKYGSLEACFMRHLRPLDENVIPALTLFVQELGNGDSIQQILPLVERGSASKRLHMYLRWMVRKDAVDPGGWDKVPASKLVMPVDTHIHRICQKLRMTRRKQANLKTALEVTEKFRKIAPDDPVRYDFSLTRLGIREKGDLPALLKRHGFNSSTGSSSYSPGPYDLKSAR